jgi:hypothetical protein
MSPQPVKKFPVLYRTRRLVTVFRTAHHWCLSRARCIKSAPSHAISLTSIPILRSHLCLSLPNGLLPSCFHIWVPVTAPWRVLLLRMKEAASRNGGYLRMHWISNLGKPTRSDLAAWRLGESQQLLAVKIKRLLWNVTRFSSLFIIYGKKF